MVNKPSYTSIKIRHSDSKIIIDIPPALYWSQYSKSTKAYIIYYCILSINIIFFTFSTPVWGYILGFCLLIEILINGRMNTYYYILMLILYLTYSLAFISSFGWINVNSLSLLAIIIDSLLFPMLRRKLIRDIFFSTKIELSYSSLSIRRKVFGRWQLDFCHKLYDLPKNYFDSIMSLKIFFRFQLLGSKYHYSFDDKQIREVTNSGIIIDENSNYKFGGLLSLNEKKWLYSQTAKYCR